MKKYNPNWSALRILLSLSLAATAAVAQDPDPNDEGLQEVVVHRLHHVEAFGRRAYLSGVQVRSPHRSLRGYFEIDTHGGHAHCVKAKNRGFTIQQIKPLLARTLFVPPESVDAAVRDVEDAWFFMHTLFELIWQYRFLYRDLNDLLSKNRRLETHFQWVLKNKTRAVKALLDGMSRAGAVTIDSREVESTATSMVVESAEGSTKLAVPTWTAVAPAIMNSRTSEAVAIPPMPMIGTSGSRRRTRLAIGWVNSGLSMMMRASGSATSRASRRRQRREP